MKKILIIVFALLVAGNTFGQESEIQQLASQNLTTFSKTSDKSFSGTGWDKLLEISKRSHSILI